MKIEPPTILHFFEKIRTGKPEPRKAIWGLAGLGVFCLAGGVSNLINLFLAG